MPVPTCPQPQFRGIHCLLLTSVSTDVCGAVEGEATEAQHRGLTHLDSDAEHMALLQM